MHATSPRASASGWSARAILDTASIGIALTTRPALRARQPLPLERLCGWQRGALAGQSLRVVWGSDEDYDRISARIARHSLDGTEFETPIHRRDGGTFLARLTVNPIDPLQGADGGTVWIVEDVTGQRQAEAALARARDEAEAANRAKSSFLANTSHELRTDPLNAMIGLARLARDPQLDAERRLQYLDQIGDSGQLLSAILSDILDLSKIESGKLTLDKAPVRPGRACCARCTWATRCSPRRAASRWELDAGPGTEGMVSGDALRVRQVISNYLTNALKFTDTGGVRIVARRVDPRHRARGGARYRPRHRPGHPGAAVPAVHAGRQPRPRARFGGTGLGLSICRELAALMGGQVGVQSSPRQGSRFWALLPLPAARTIATPPADTTPALQGARVLMVEDNPVNMMIAVAMLERWGLSVEQAVDGLQAVAAVERAQAQGHPIDGRADGRADAADERLRGDADAAPQLRREDAADHRADRRRARDRARRGAGLRQ